MFQYIKAGRCFGPVSATDLLQLYDAAVLGAEDLARLDGISTWRLMRDMVADLRGGRFNEDELSRARKNSGRPAGAHTVMTSAPPPLPPNPLPCVGGRRCPRCATEMRGGAHFCKQCGSQLPAPLCDVCGRPNDHDAIVCDGCGRERARA